MAASYEWRGELHNTEINLLHAEGFGHGPRNDDWVGQLSRHSLGWVCARDQGVLVGFVNVAWDGGVHAFVLDTLVRTNAQRRGIATRLVALAVHEARAAGCEWLHVDFYEHLRSIEPSTLGWLFPRSRAKRAVVAILTAFAIFGFYGGAGWFEGGPISHVTSVVSVCGLFPAMALVGVSAARAAFFPDEARVQIGPCHAALSKVGSSAGVEDCRRSRVQSRCASERMRS